ncbi:hypothetical protein Avbf_07094 [Armadillidium vulgare]|nr:hypothetical protein Avbf_07094 [Armadillidium vulgare]
MFVATGLCFGLVFELSVFVNFISVANKVFVSECYDSKTARCISTLLEIPLQEVKPKEHETGQTKEEISEIEAFVSSCRLQSEVGSTNSSTDVQYDEESNKCKSLCVKKSLSKSKSPLKSFSENENKKIHFEKRSSRSSSLSRKTIAKQENREHSSNSYERVHHNRRKSRSPKKRRRSRSSSKTETKKRKKSDSKSRKKAKKKSKTKNSDSFPGNKRKNHHENEERLDYDEKNSSPSEELSHVSKRKRHSSYHSSSSSNNNKLDLDKTCDEFSEKLSPSEELPHVSKRKRESLYHSSSSSNNKLDIDKTCDEFSVVGTLKLLLAVEDKLGILGSAVLSLVKSVEENEENATKMWNLFVDEENIILLNMIVDKLKGLLLTSHSHEISIITKTTEWVQKLIEEAKMKSEHTVDDSCTKEEVTIDLDSIAIASFDKSPDHILGLIKTAFAYEGKINPTKEEIHHAYLQVCYLQFELAVKEST